MRWRRRDHVFVADGSASWAATGALVPSPLVRSTGELRVYVGCLDDDGRGRVGWVELDRSDPSRVVRTAERPVLDLGLPGAFDDNGVLPLCTARDGDLVYLFYVGFQLGVKVRFSQFAGVAVSTDDGETFERVQDVPVIDRSADEPVGRAGAYVLNDEGVWKMWYLASSRWTDADGKALPIYDVRYLESDDLLSWGAAGRLAIAPSLPDEYVIARPWVVRDGDVYRMLYSSRTRSRGYRLGYGESSNGIEWTRKDEELGLEPSGEGWDSDEVLWSSLVDTDAGTFLLYNGNDLGRAGFGCAELLEW